MDYDLNYQEDSNVNAADIANKIGDECPESGTYECSTCGEEIAAEAGTKFPSCDNCGDDHTTWDLIS